MTGLVIVHRTAYIIKDDWDSPPSVHSIQANSCKPFVNTLGIPCDSSELYSSPHGTF